MRVSLARSPCPADESVPHQSLTLVCPKVGVSPTWRWQRKHQLRTLLISPRAVETPRCESVPHLESPLYCKDFSLIALQNLQVPLWDCPHSEITAQTHQHSLPNHVGDRKSVSQRSTDNCNYHLYFVPLLYLFCYTFNTAWIYFLMFM